jgi:hypothetical protein
MVGVAGARPRLLPDTTLERMTQERYNINKDQGALAQTFLV